MRVALITCSKEKLDHGAMATDLYTGPIFQLSRDWVVRRLHPKHGPINEWGILSAKHGLLLPEDRLEPYDVDLNRMGAKEQRDWAERAKKQLLKKWGKEVIYLIIAGDAYRGAVNGLPLVEDLITSWANARMANGMSRRAASMGIGLIKQYLMHNVEFGCTYKKMNVPKKEVLPTG